MCDCTDVGATKFVVTYADKSKQAKQWFCSGDEFRDCFLAIKQLVPACEDVPCVLITSEDSTEM